MAQIVVVPDDVAASVGQHAHAGELVLRADAQVGLHLDRRTDAVPGLRRLLRQGRDRIASVSGVLGRTVSRILTRHDLFALVACDPVTGLPTRAARSTAHRYERDRPGDSREQSSTAAWT